jgi:hypothetical protein
MGCQISNLMAHFFSKKWLCFSIKRKEKGKRIKVGKALFLKNKGKR